MRVEISVLVVNYTFPFCLHRVPIIFWMEGIIFARHRFPLPAVYICCNTSRNNERECCRLYPTHQRLILIRGRIGSTWTHYSQTWETVSMLDGTQSTRNYAVRKSFLFLHPVFYVNSEINQARRRNLRFDKPSIRKIQKFENKC